ncbi:MAG: MAPEG family protein [Pseudomonadota bacterium]
MSFPIIVTGYTTVALAIVHMALTFRVIGKRRSDKIIHGDADDKDMMKRIRGHANASEQIPIALITLGLAEWVASGWWIIVIAIGFVTGRVMHGLYFAYHGFPHQFRVFGMLLTLVFQIAAIATLLIGLVLN